MLNARPNSAALAQEVTLRATARSTERRKADLPGLDQRQTEQLAPRAREGRAAAQDSQAGAEGRRKADGEEKRQNEQSDPRVRAAAQDGPVRAEDHRKSGVDKTPSRPGPA